jgi:pimeloyl-ACP methyl ester carboxylesterase
VLPETRYARNGDVSLAYQVAGDGPLDVVFVPGFLSNVELAWSTPPFATIFPRLASFARLIVFDRRNTGMSDRVTGQQIIETSMDDIRAVLDAAGSARAALIGVTAGAPMSLLLAATYPARTSALVLVGGYARWLWAPDYPWGRTDAQYRTQNDASNRVFSSREEAVEVARWIGNFGDAEAEQLADYFRRSGSPGRSTRSTTCSAGSTSGTSCPRSASRRSSSTAPRTRSRRSRAPATRRARSPARASSSSRASGTSRQARRSTGHWTSSSGSCAR